MCTTFQVLSPVSNSKHTNVKSLNHGLPLQNDAKKLKKMTETLARVYSSESTQRELSIEYQHDRVGQLSKL